MSAFHGHPGFGRINHYPDNIIIEHDVGNISKAVIDSQAMSSHNHQHHHHGGGDWNSRMLFNRGGSTHSVKDVDKDTFWPTVEAAGDKLVVLDLYTRW